MPKDVHAHRSQMVWRLYTKLDKPKIIKKIEPLFIASNTKKKTRNHLVLTLDFDNCLDILQKNTQKILRDPVFTLDGYCGGCSSAKTRQRMVYAHYLLRLMLEHAVSNFKIVTLVNSSLEQSVRRTSEFAKIAQAYNWRFDSMRNDTRKASTSRALFKKQTVEKHVEKYADAFFLFIDDLKANVNSVRKINNVELVAIHLDYNSLANKRISLSKYALNAFEKFKPLFSKESIAVFEKTLNDKNFYP